MTNKFKGVIAIAAPFILLIFILAAFAVTQFVISSMTVTVTEQSMTVANIIRIVLSFLGIISVLGVFVGLGFGLHYFSTPNQGQPLPTHPSYAQLAPEQVAFIQHASWGAFFATPVWALGNKLYLYAFLSLVPVVNLFFWIYLTVNGRRLAWEKGWTSFDQFKQRQTMMTYVIAALILLYVAIRVLKVLTA